MPFRTRLSFTPRNATRLVRQHRLDGGPFVVGEFVAHDSSPQFGSLNHGSPAKRNAPGPLLVRRLRTGADINQSSIFDKCVENDPKRTCAIWYYYRQCSRIVRHSVPKLVLTIRAISAILLTGIVSGFVVIALSSAYYLLWNYLSSYGSGSASGLFEMTSFLWFVASLVGIGAAAILGATTEWPKALWLAKQSCPSRTSNILVSILAAETLMLVPTIVGLWRNPAPIRDMCETLLFSGFAGAVGGICSAVLWWKLVLVPLRRGR